MTFTNFHLTPSAVCMFPGLGAEYPDMLPAFCRQHPWAEALIGEWEKLIGKSFLSNAPDNAMDREYIRQLRIHCLNLLWWRVACIARGDRIICCGHSLGYYAALVAAGVLTEEASWFWLTTVFQEAWRDFSEHSSRIEVLTTTVAIDPYRLARQFNVEVIARNSSQQLVIHGPQANINQLCDSLKWASLRRSDLGTVIPFHSIAMCRVSEKLLKIGEQHRGMFNTPHYEVWSHLTGSPLDSVESIYLTLLEQPMRTVNWQLLIQNLSNRFQPVFIEIGPNRILSQLVRWSNPQANTRHVDHIRKENHRMRGETA